jgi:hypothetical protein
MKKILMNVLTFLLIVSILIVLLVSLGDENGVKYIYKGNTEHKVIPFQSKEYRCSDCSMDVEDLHYAAELITQEGDTYFFDDIGCVVLWLQKHAKAKKNAKIFTQTLDTHQWIDAKDAWFSRIAPSPMGYGFAAYAKKEKKFVNYLQMQQMMLQGKNLYDPFVKKSLLGK